MTDDDESLFEYKETKKQTKCILRFSQIAYSTNFQNSSGWRDKRLVDSFLHIFLKKKKLLIKKSKKKSFVSKAFERMHVILSAINAVVIAIIFRILATCKQ